LGNETETKEISLAQIQPVLHARIEEVLCLAYDKLIESAAIESIDGGVVITGGMAFTPGIKELATLVFENMPVKIANPRNIQNGYVNFNIPTMSTIVGLLYYELSCENSFELDSNGNLRDENTSSQRTQHTMQNTTINGQNNQQSREDRSRDNGSNISDIKDITTIKNNQSKEKKTFAGIFHKISRWL
jgi:cell division protein FtsA